MQLLRCLVCLLVMLMSSDADASDGWVLAEYSGDSTITVSSTSDADPAIHLHLDIDGKLWDNRLHKLPGVYSSDAMLTVIQGSDVVEQVPTSNINTSTYTDEDGLTVFSVVADELDGIVISNNGVIHVHAKAGAQLEVSNEGNVLGVCGGTDSEVDHGRRLVEKWTNCYDGDSVQRSFSIGVAVGSGLFQRKFSNDLEAVANWINLIVAEANLIYRAQMNIVLTVGQVIIQQGSQDAPTWDDPACQLGLSGQLNQFQAWTQPSKQGLWHLFDDCFGSSGSSIGLATMLVSDAPGTLCMMDPVWNGEFWNTAVSWYSSNTWKTFAHEVGHNFGGHHSFEEGQGQTGGIMDYGDGKLNGEYQFNTKYRQTQICASIQKVVATCSAFSTLIDDSPATTTTSSGLVLWTTTTTTGVSTTVTMNCGSSCQDSLGVTSTMRFNGVRYTDCESLISATNGLVSGLWCSQFEARFKVCQKSCGVCSFQCATASTTQASTTTQHITTVTTAPTTIPTTTSSTSTTSVTTAPSTIPTTTSRTSAGAVGIQSGDTIFLRARSGNGMHIDSEGSTVQARWESQGSWQALTIETANGGEVTSGDTVYLRTHAGVFIDVTGDAVQARYNDKGAWQAMTIEKSNGGTIMPDDIVCLRAHTGKHLDVQDSLVRASRDDCGDRQQMRIEREAEGALFSGDAIYLTAHNGKLIDVEGNAVRARWSARGAWQTFLMTNYGGRTIASGDTVFLKAHTGKFVHVEGVAVRALWNDRGDWQKFILEKKDGASGPIFPGDIIFLRAHTNKMIEVSQEDVQARWLDNGDWQALVIEQSISRRLANSSAYDLIRGSSSGMSTEASSAIII